MRNMYFGKSKDPVAEAASAKIWAIYVAEAEKYDKALIESWKCNMEGMLIFAGLFSASLTAFLIESYKTLNPDPTVQLLTQISIQLSSSSNGSGVLPVPASSPPTSALVCNGLWFTSLGLSLSCALVATLLEQWARDFIHRSEMKSGPLMRARIFSFLYYGLRRFSLHSVVDIVPLLLHAALLLFLAGLVAFLIPVSIPMAVLSAVILVIISGVYTVLTFHPLRYLDSPYRTPLSGIFWGVFRWLKAKWRPHRGGIVGDRAADDETILEAITREATELSDAATSRDGKALAWTAKSLSDESELELFVQAIPRTLWALGVRREAYRGHFRALVLNPEVALYRRLRALLDSCDTGLPHDVRRSRLISCYQALWALATLFVSSEPEPLPLPDPSPLPFLTSPGGYVHDVGIRVVSVSSGVLIQWIHFQSARSNLTHFRQKLVQWGMGGLEPDLSPLKNLLDELSQRPEYHFARPVPEPLQQRSSAVSAIVSRQVADFNDEEHEWLDEVLAKTQLIPLCLEQATAEYPIPLPGDVIRYLCDRKSDGAVCDSLGSIHIDIIWEAFARALLEPSFRTSPSDILRAFWRVAFSTRAYTTEGTPFIHHIQQIAHSYSPSITDSVAVLVASWYLCGREYGGNGYTDPIYPSETAVAALSQPVSERKGHQDNPFWELHTRNTEARLSLVADFLESCASSEDYPYEAVKTLQRIQAVNMITTPVHSSIQLRLANSIQSVFRSFRCTELQTVVINSRIFVPVHGRTMRSPLPPATVAYSWLDNEPARRKIGATFTAFADEISASANAEADVAVVNAILDGLGPWHTPELDHHSNHAYPPTNFQ
ncbi:hypothetical protein MSAN_01954600 [Mycena sanguinolenta]|uniref:DUF6535 domain-containing protein n=1 Tax=Mycena sanguinolenta TaxID=230812 RepID=A0A8H6XLA3_9AGAR|nr:hypothetical protein MSAN_01954600 [Mycena sanguinolenta]